MAKAREKAEESGGAADEVVWKDPPVQKSGPRSKVWFTRLAPLKKHRGRWAMVKTASTRNAASATAFHLRHGGGVVPPGRWEFAARGCEVYARYLGPEEKA